VTDNRATPKGDRELGDDLTTLAGHRTRSVAAALVELDTSPKIRFAFIDADPTTRFEIGSVSKAITGMALADAVERREVGLDTTIDNLLPESEGTPFGSITIKELCTHTSGLPRLPRSLITLVRAQRFLLLGSDPYRGTTPSKILKDASSQWLWRRGHRRYSNLAAAALGQLLARRAGTDYGSLLSDRIFAPLEMTTSAVASSQETAAPGWSSKGRRRQPWVMGGYSPAGGVISTISDMARLAVALLEGSAPGTGSLKPLSGIDTGRPNRATGMFWVIDSGRDSNRTMVWHNGQTGGYSSFFGLFPDRGVGVVVLANVARARELQRIAVGLLFRNVAQNRSALGG
jgi:CubicO group peptidase (beta-lactamase class C family)